MSSAEMWPGNSGSIYDEQKKPWPISPVSPHIPMVNGWT